MRRIDGDAKSIRSMLSGSKFAIDYYQREYRWESKQVAELLDDLAEKFLESHEPGNERSAVEQYGHYFLGSIIISDKDGQKFIIDGQQRLTSTTLFPTDMLKGYLLANITDAERRIEAIRVWRDRESALQQLGKEEDADAVKAWLRSQHAQTIRERKRGAQPRDFDLIGTEFHRWVRDHEEPLGLTASASFGRFIQEDFDFYSRWYERIRQAAETLTPGLEAIHYNAQNKFTLQYPVLLAPLRRADSDEEIHRKLRIVAGYLDILIERLDADEETFASHDQFHLHGMNRPQVHRLLARMTHFVETRSGQQSRFAEYMKRGKKGYEVEHIWANHPDRHTDEFAHPTDFAEYRNRIGGLLLLPKSFNASYGDKPYAEKRDHYFGQNLLAQSLHETAYEHNPGFRKFREESGLSFQPCAEFKKTDLDARQELYRQIAEQIWSPDVLRREVEA